jgi:RHS repeat-associated protein
VNVRGQYYTGTAWHYFDVASAFDHRNRRVFKSFLDETTGKMAQSFFYYDVLDRLTEVRYTPDISSPGTYSVFQLFWLDGEMILYWQTDFPSAITSKRYGLHDETGRIYEMWNWPASGNASVVWIVNPSAWGNDTTVYNPTIFQPLVFAGQYQDRETAAYENDGSTIHRPGLSVNGFRTYDGFTGAYLQSDPFAEQTRTTYVYADSNPVGEKDRDGRMQASGINSCTDSCDTAPIDRYSACVGMCEGVGPGDTDGGGGGGGGGGSGGSGTVSGGGSGANPPSFPPNPGDPSDSQPDDDCTAGPAYTGTGCQNCYKYCQGQPLPTSGPYSWCHFLEDEVDCVHNFHEICIQSVCDNFATGPCGEACSLVYHTPSPHASGIGVFNQGVGQQGVIQR